MSVRYWCKQSWVEAVLFPFSWQEKPMFFCLFVFIFFNRFHLFINTFCSDFWHFGKLKYKSTMFVPKPKYSAPPYWLAYFSLGSYFKFQLWCSHLIPSMLTFKHCPVRGKRLLWTLVRVTPSMQKCIWGRGSTTKPTPLLRTSVHPEKLSKCSSWEALVDLVRLPSALWTTSTCSICQVRLLGEDEWYSALLLLVLIRLTTLPSLNDNLSTDFVNPVNK